MQLLKRAIHFSAVSLILILTSGLSTTAADQPDLSGHWVPIDTARAAQLFDVGLSDVTAAGITIAEDATSITVTRDGVPAGFVASIVPKRASYHIGTDAARWDNEQLVLVTTYSNAVARAVYSLLEPHVMMVQTAWTTNQGVMGRIVETFQREP